MATMAFASSSAVVCAAPGARHSNTSKGDLREVQSLRCCCGSTSCSSAPRPARLVSLSGWSPAPSALVRPAAPMSVSCQASPDKPPPAATEKLKSILCSNCEGNGAVVCSQCEGEGLNTQDFFGGRFKSGTICWLCRGKKQMLCGNCNGAGFMGGFLNTQDD